MTAVKTERDGMKAEYPSYQNICRNKNVIVKPHDGRLEIFMLSSRCWGDNWWIIIVAVIVLFIVFKDNDDCCCEKQITSCC